MPKHALVSLGAVALAALLFSLPLVMRHHVYQPRAIRLVTGDVVAVDHEHLSTLWCRGVELRTNSSSKASSFSALLFSGQPEVERNGTLVTTSTTRSVLLQNRAQEYWGFHLLRGSEARISGCARLGGAALTVVRGYQDLRRCVREHKQRFLHPDGSLSSEENSHSESESDDETSSISSSQGVVSNESDSVYSCRSALYHVHLPSKYTCGKEDGDRKPVLTHDVDVSGRYYYVVTSDTYLDIIPNRLSVNFTMRRARYDRSASVRNCSGSVLCQLPYGLGSEDRVVVEMSSGDGVLKTHALKVACQPRKGLYFLFYAGFTIVIFLCAYY